MKLWIIIPVKPLGEGKSRLTSVLAPAQRGALSQRILQRELDLVLGHELVAGVAIVSRDQDLLENVAALGALPLWEEQTGLNQALETARQQVICRGADAILILPADLPFLAKRDIEQLHGTLAQGSQVVLAPSSDGGTNALGLRPPSLMGFAFGPQSFTRHRHAAQQLGLRQQVLVTPTLAFDVDWPADWELLRTSFPDLMPTPTS
jgi:2-phospho-L-lactate guanylyltransferase